MRLKVAIASSVSWPYARRGNRFIHELATYLARKDHQIHIITSKPGSVSRVRLEGDVLIQYNRLPLTSIVDRINMHQYETFIPVCLRSYLEEDYDIIQTFFPPEAFAASLNKVLNNTPFVHLLVATTPFYLPTMFGKAMFKRVLKTASRLHVPSNYVSTQLKTEFGVEGELIPMSVDTEQFTPSGEKNRDPLYILCTSSFLDPRKRVALLVKAFEQVLDHIPNAVLQLSGSDYQDGMRVKATLLQSVKPKTRRAIQILGVGILEDLPTLYRNANVTVLPSVKEAFGMVILESLASGTPVVGTRSGAIPEILNDPQIGVLFEATDGPKELSQAIIKGLELAEVSQTPQRCCEHAKHYSWDNIGPRYEKLFSEILSNSNKRARTTAKKKKVKKRNAIKAVSPDSQLSHATSRHLFKNRFDDALDELDITYETYHMIDHYRPRCIYILDWLRTNKIPKGSTLVIGVYPRPLTMFFQKLGYIVNCMSVTQKLEPWKELENEMLLSDFQILKSLPDNYDLIICDDLLQHLITPVQTIRMLNDHLSAEGVLILVTKNVARAKTRLRLLSGRNIYPGLFAEMANDGSLLENVQKLMPYREYTLQEAKGLLVSSGLEVMDSRCITGTKSILQGAPQIPLKTYFFSKISYLTQKVARPLRSHLFLAARSKPPQNQNRR